MGGKALNEKPIAKKVARKTPKTVLPKRKEKKDKPRFVFQTNYVTNTEVAKWLKAAYESSESFQEHAVHIRMSNSFRQLFREKYFQTIAKYVHKAVKMAAIRTRAVTFNADKTFNSDGYQGAIINYINKPGFRVKAIDTVAAIQICEKDNI